MKTLIMLILPLLPVLLCSAYLENLPTEVTQPDGTVLNLLASGDEFANRLHDANGYSIVQSQADGYFYYAQKNGDEIVPSAWKAGKVDPATKNLVPKLNISEAEYRARAELRHRNDNQEVRFPQTGRVNNICVFIRFSDQTEFTTPRSVYKAKFNAIGDSAISLCNYYKKVSYNQLEIITSFYPICQPESNLSYQDSHPRGYYAPYNAVTNPIGYTGNAEYAVRQNDLLVSAINFIAAQVPTTLELDADNDNYLDNICFISRGGHTAWCDLLWAQCWYLSSVIYINGKRVYKYTFQPENQNEVQTLCHEMFHSVGAPDLYHYSFDEIIPTGSWELMSAGRGHMSAYMKWKYAGWLPAATLITQTGDYTLNPVTSATNNHYQINVAGVPGESIHLEYRKKGSDCFESKLVDSGLLIYHVRSNITGNVSGPPDELNIYRPDGSATFNGQIGNAAFSADRNRTEFNDYTNPNCLLVNNVLGHVNISNISFCGETISFHYSTDPLDLPPTIQNVYPPDGEVLPPGEQILFAEMLEHSSPVSQVEFKLDGTLLETFTTGPYNCFWTADQTDLGWHDLVVTATTVSGLTSCKHTRFQILDPQLETWFDWVSDDPDYYSFAYTLFGSSPTPVQIAVDFDLGMNDLVIKKLAFNLEDDPFGDPSVQGLVSVQINRFANGAITSEVLLDLGNFTCPMNGLYEVDIDNDTVLNGKIAFIVNTYEYQNMIFDFNGISGHSWMKVPDIMWMDCQSHMMLGAAHMGLKLQSPNAVNDENLVIPARISLNNYPNPFNSETTISYTMPAKGQVCLAIYNSKGQLVKSLLDEPQAKGEHTLTWNGKDDNNQSVASGLYLCRITSAGKHESIKLLMLK